MCGCECICFNVQNFSQKCEYFSQKNAYASFPDATSVRKGTVSFMVKQRAKRVPTTTSLPSVKLYQHYIHFYSPSGFSVPLNFFFLFSFLVSIDSSQIMKMNVDMAVFISPYVSCCI